MNDRHLVVAGVTHRYVNVGRLRVHVAEAGEGEPVVLLHGWPQHWYVWRHVIPRLAPHFRLICPDMRGFGWTDAPRAGYEKEQLASDLLGLLDALGLDQVRLVGHDWGGFTAFLVALRAPRRVRQLIVLNMIHPWPKQVPTLLNSYRFLYQFVMASGLGALILRFRPELFSTAIRQALYDRTAMTDEEINAFTDRLTEPARANATVQLYRTFLLHEAAGLATGRYDAERLGVPTLLLFGVHDLVLRPEMLAGYEEHADDMRVELVPDAGHLVVDERPELVSERVLEFFGAGVEVRPRERRAARGASGRSQSTRRRGPSRA